MSEKLGAMRVGERSLWGRLWRGDTPKSGDWRAEIKLHISVGFVGEPKLERIVDP
jgi:hypothetical protein